MNAIVPQPKPSLISKITRAPRDAVVVLFDMLLNGTERGDARPRPGYASNAEWSIRQSDARGARVLLWTSLLAIALLLIWAAFANIDEVVRGEGKVVPSRQVQVVQSLDGGVVEEINVRPGQVVEPGQVLLKLDPTRSASSLGENNAEYLSLLARSARQSALATGAPFVMPDEVLKQAPALGESERNAYLARTQELDATVNVAKEQLNQRSEEMRETVAKRDQASTSCKLTTRELTVTRPLLATGAVAEVDLLRLERDVAHFCGDEKSANATLDRTQSAIKEARSKIQEAELNIRNQARSDLSETNAKLSALRESRLALADRVKLSEIRSPVRGTIKTLLANTVGGVVQPGKDIIEIVPNDDSLLLEVRVLPRDIGFLHAQQKAQVKFTAYDFAIYGGLDGVVEQIGADSTTDEKGNSFYIVRVRTSLATVGDKKLPIIPGMVAEVHILTGKRTVLQYLLKPILRAKANAFTER